MSATEGLFLGCARRKTSSVSTIRFTRSSGDVSTSHSEIPRRRNRHTRSVRRVGRADCPRALPPETRPPEHLHDDQNVSVGRAQCLPRLQPRDAQEGRTYPPCEECRKLWLPGDDERWQAYWVDDGPEELLLFYCPDCAEREFSQTL